MNDLIVRKIDKARLLLAEARDATDAKEVADLARAAEVYARRQKLSEEAIAYATAVKVDAMTLMGEFLKAGPKNTGSTGQFKGRTASGSPKENRPKERPTQEGLFGPGGKKVASDAQALADLKQTAPDLHEKVRQGKTTVSKARREVRRQVKRDELRQKADAAGDAPANWKIIAGDCLAESVKVSGKSARLIFMDPPYNQGVDYGGGVDADLMTDEDYLRWFEITTHQLRHRLTDDGSLWVLIGDEYAAEFALIFQEQGLTLRNWIIWYETFGVNCTNKFNRTKRHLLYFVKDPSRLVFHPDAVTRPSDRQTKYNDARANPGGKLLDDVWTDIPRLTGTAAERIPDFPTQLPLALLLRVVSCCTDPGDLVIDPFSGSATTGAAALRLGRRYIGIEKEQRFVDLSTLRLKGETNGRDPGE